MASGHLASLQPGAIFAGDFRVVRPLSEGGMGAVYVVEQLSTGRQRALKLMLPQLVADPKLRARFEQEARIGSRIESEHVIEVVGAGVDATTGAPWLAMELLRGEDLASLVRRSGPFPRAAMLEILGQLCHALGAAHNAGIVHRDLKPENVFVAQSKQMGVLHTVKVLDFGIAKVVAEAKTTATDAVGSPMWMAPEQTARMGVIGPQTDVWAIGLIVFHLLTARYFWRSAEDEGATVAHLLREIVMDPMALASQRAREVGMEAAMSPSFDAWFARSTDRDPLRRFPHASAQFEALGACLAGESAAAPPPVASPAMARTLEQRPLPSVGVTTTAGAVSSAEVPENYAVPRHALGGKIAVGGLLAVVVGGGAIGGAYLLTRGDASSKPVTASSISAAASPSASAAVAKPPTANAWITIAPPAHPITLGVKDEKSPDPGFRPSRGVTAPAVAYEIQQHEVTWEEIDSYRSSHDVAIDEPAWVPKEGRARSKLPATGVHWDAAMEYCRSLGGTLPSEEQWEYAARGPDLRPNPWGIEQLDLSRTVAFTGNSKSLPFKEVDWSDQDQTPGAEVSALKGMSGNALEWTVDLYRDDRPNQSESWAQEGGLTYRAVRGLPVRDTVPKKLPPYSAAYRQSLCATGPCPAATAALVQYVGFRCARHDATQGASQAAATPPEPAAPRGGGAQGLPPSTPRSQVVARPTVTAGLQSTPGIADDANARALQVQQRKLQDCRNQCAQSMMENECMTACMR